MYHNEKLIKHECTSLKLVAQDCKVLLIDIYHVFAMILNFNF